MDKELVEKLNQKEFNAMKSEYLVCQANAMSLYNRGYISSSMRGMMKNFCSDKLKIELQRKLDLDSKTDVPVSSDCPTILRKEECRKQFP